MKKTTETVALRTTSSPSDIEGLLQAYLEQIRYHVLSGESVNINGFGIQPFATGTPGNEEYARIHLLHEDIISHHNNRIDSLHQIYRDEQELIKAAQPLVKELHQKMTAQAKELFATTQKRTLLRT